MGMISCTLEDIQQCLETFLIITAGVEGGCAIGTHFAWEGWHQDRKKSQTLYKVLTASQVGRISNSF